MVDIITTVRNGERYLVEAIESVLKQSFTNWQYFIVDNGSTDGTTKIIQHYSQSDTRISHGHQPVPGIPLSLNYALKNTNSKYIAILDADDLWHAEKLKLQIEYLENHDNCDFCFSMIEEFNSPENLQSHNFRARPNALKGLSKCAVMFRRAIIDQIGDFKEEVIAGDFIEWFSRYLRLNKAYHILPKILVYRRVHGENMTATLDRNGYLAALKKHIDEKRKLAE